MKTHVNFAFLAVPFASLAVGLLSGCSASFAPSAVVPNEVAIGNIQGSVHGGQLPVVGAKIYLFAASTAGYGKASTSLIKSGGTGVACNTTGAQRNDCYVTTGAGGSFSLSGDYTCTEGTQVYMVAQGGDPLAGAGVADSAVVQMAALGQCPASGSMASQVPYLVINEVTTVAMAYSMSGFGSDAFHISADATGATALANAMANANNIVNIQYGQAPAVVNGNPNSVNPWQKIYALANSVAACVNSDSPTSTYCNQLFTNARNSSNAVPTDESTALFNIAQHQASNAANIFGVAYLTPTIPFAFPQGLTQAPSDWTMPVIYNGLVSVPSTGGVPPAYTSGPFNIAFDASGNAWIGDRALGVVEIGPQGAATTINNGFVMVKGVAVSPIDGTIWVSDYGSNKLDVMNSAGSILTPLTTDMNGPILTSFSGNTSGQAFAYEANETTTGVVAFDPVAYTVQDFENANFGSVTTPGWITVDNNGNTWIPSTSTSYVGQVTAQEKGKSGNFTFGSSQISGPPSSYSMAADSNGNLWLGTDSVPGGLEEIASGFTTATAISGNGGVNGPYKLAVDGNNTVWIANSGANTVSAYVPSSSTWLTSTGFSTGAQSGTGCVVVAPDPSGNLWTANSDGSVTQLLGLAKPTAAPLYGGVTSNSKSFAGNLGTMP